MPKVLHFNIQLLGVHPPIWRTFTVDDNYRFDRFHQVIQLTVGWHNAHLHEFRYQDRSIGMLLDNDFDMPEIEDETKIYLKHLKLSEGDTLLYIYDFGDYWEHILTLEKIEEKSSTPLPICTGGANACPLEDSGGVPGYMNLIEVLTDPTHEEYEDYQDWAPPGFNPTHFNLKATNYELKEFGKWHRKYPRKKSTPWHQI